MRWFFVPFVVVVFLYRKYCHNIVSRAGLFGNTLILGIAIVIVCFCCSYGWFPMSIETSCLTELSPWMLPQKVNVCLPAEAHREGWGVVGEGATEAGHSSTPPHTQSILLTLSTAGSIDLEHLQCEKFSFANNAGVVVPSWRYPFVG